MGILDIFFPKYCVRCRKIGEYLCDVCFSYLSFSRKTICLHCGRGAINGLTHPTCRKKYGIDGCFVGMVYQVVMKKLIYQFKYKPYVSQLQIFFTNLLYESMMQHGGFQYIYQKKQDILVIPIPLFSEKLKKRGYNHAALLAQTFANQVFLPFADVLIRNKQTVSQFGLTKEERMKNISGVFAVKDDAVVKGKTILCVDDIVTTGATVLEAAFILKKAGAKNVYAVALAGEE